MEMLTIGQVAISADVAASTIRYYEQIGLLPAPIRVNGQRRYTNKIMRKLATIRLGQAAGFSLAEIHALLYNFPADAPPAERWQKLAHRKLDELDAQIHQLQMQRALLEQTMQCQCESLEECAAEPRLPPGW